MFHWIVRIATVGFALVAAARSARDRFVLGSAAGIIIGLLAILEMVRPESYFLTMGPAALVALGALFATIVRERKLPLARTQTRDLIWPFLWLTGAILGGVLLSLLAFGVG